MLNYSISDNRCCYCPVKWCQYWNNTYLTVSLQGNTVQITRSWCVSINPASCIYIIYTNGNLIFDQIKNGSLEYLDLVILMGSIYQLIYNWDDSFTAVLIQPIFRFWLKYCDDFVRDLFHQHMCSELWTEFLQHQDL